ncbi:alpha/beta hydrolase family protein [Lysobacter solisilvae (ex Woo and Kim 2020)]|uniref:S9 family peptidase n=1 Tax=Agrilutibacter terrestris TaxID=2865112 RepID=A0A7H0FYJ8_9GAMM|nr:S9 family peptidase [Lysobacter terrestris]QNP41114.1 S9 family peptidase [Lysobacter terrestris]
MKQVAKLLAGMAALGFVSAAAAVDVDAYVRKDMFEEIKLSPNGEYFAATLPKSDRTSLVVLRRSDNKVMSNVSGGSHTVVADFDWVSADRVVVSLAEKFGALAKPQLTGELYGVSATGGSGEMLVGQRLQGAGLGTKIQPKKVEAIWAFLVDDLPADDKNVIISVSPMTDDPFTRVDRMDAYTGRRHQIARAPVRNAWFSTDNAGVVRFASGAGVDNVRKLYHRSGEGVEWDLVSDEAVTHRAEHPIGFSEDNRTAYLQSEQPKGPDAIVAYDTVTGERKVILRDDDSDPVRIIYHNGTRIPVGAVFMDGRPRTAFFDDKSKEAILYRSLEAAFGGDAVKITSQTSDGRLALVEVSSDRSPGDFYIFDTVAKKAEHLLSRRQWFDPDKMASMRPITLKARDGLTLHGYVTAPKVAAGTKLPMVVMPHGGPFGVQDKWGFDGEVQMLADAGYAVLQVNFRGSGGYGAEFIEAGARQWGLTMQDDLTDATRWAIQEGIADPSKVCTYGGSYGGYAALMGVAKEPALYRCAVGYVGVYDLPTMHTDGDIQRRGSGETYLREWIGERTALADTSPSRMAAKIKAPVFLAAGGEDDRAPIKHSEMMEKALRKEGVAVETLYFANEGHGFYVEANRREYYTRLLSFLGKHLGGEVASAAAASGGATAK